MLTQSWSYWRSPDTDLQHCCKIAWILRGNFAHHILHDSITSILHQICVAGSIFHPVTQHHLNTASCLCCRFHFSSCPAASPQCCFEFVSQVLFFILSSSITSMLHKVCVASSITYPVQQHHLNIASSLCCKSHFSSCPAASPQYCIKFVFQAPFYILSSSITSMLYQVCVASSIIHPVQQYHLNIASSLCCKSYFSSYPAASPQYYIKFAL